MLSLGAVLFLDGLNIYTFYRVTDGDGGASNGTVNVQCLDLRFNDTVTEIDGRDLYVSLEFAGALCSVVFYVSMGKTLLTVASILDEC